MTKKQKAWAGVSQTIAVQARFVVARVCNRANLPTVSDLYKAIIGMSFDGSFTDVFSRTNSVINSSALKISVLLTSPIFIQEIEPLVQNALLFLLGVAPLDMKTTKSRTVVLPNDYLAA